ncbi:hypothetical protein EIN_097800 [Entamoeba invadens IP1]|uniref:Uncharacterized protein n=1 Tax=Entamoeba invadens IP1 TaxID=370355 RepID=A0A0A1U458_ENTIV|nr:hypothetical protein EIN_097800 [Entamoeba invadens IP1]ELP87493.1 hypothetical protein EIN_097800 [Entamoeba invadens IP1]|eukprot:XP_004254264.1 hypothetical protein EIN_097800 [Entamoeba invadens IP1]
MELDFTTPQEEILRRRKRVSRNEETTLVNALVFLIVKLGFNVKIKKTKKTVHTVKMLIIEEMVHRESGKALKQEDVARYSQFLLKELGHPHMEEAGMTLKQLKRSREAELNNALIYFLKRVGFSFEEKKTKKSKCTEKLVRLNSLTYGDIVFNKELLAQIGEFIEDVVRQEMSSGYVEITEILLKKYDSIKIPKVSFNEVLSMKLPEHPKSTPKSIPKIENIKQKPTKPKKIKKEEQIIKQEPKEQNPEITQDQVTSICSFDQQQPQQHFQPVCLDQNFYYQMGQNTQQTEEPIYYIGPNPMFQNCVPVQSYSYDFNQVELSVDSLGQTGSIGFQDDLSYKPSLACNYMESGFGFTQNYYI